jgi:hypothetical protein
VTFVGASGVTLQNPVGYKINRQFDSCYLEKITLLNLHFIWKHKNRMHPFKKMIFSLSLGQTVVAIPTTD